MFLRKKIKLFGLLLGIVLWMNDGQAQTIIYVDAASVAPAPDGLSWATAFQDLQAGLTLARDTLGGNPAPNTVQIWVAQGTYTPGIERFNSFELAENVELYGGFVGTETMLSQRDFTNNLTILSGNIGDVSLDTDNSYHVLTANCAGSATGCNGGADGIDSTAIVDGFTISGGYADGDQLRENNGGALYSLNSSPTIRNCVVQNHFATADGGSIYAANGQLLIENTRFYANTSNGSGGAIYFTNSAGYIYASEFRGNQANEAGQKGGAVVVSNFQGDKVTNFYSCLFSGNVGSNRGGAINAQGAGCTVNLFNCTLSANATSGAGSQGGGINSEINATIIIQNSIIWNNSSVQGGTTNQVSGNTTITFSILEGVDTPADNVLNEDPQFVSPVDPDVTPSINGDFNVNACAASPAVDAGDNALANGIANDLNGNPRIVDIGNGATVDLGAYEVQAAPVRPTIGEITANTGTIASNVLTICVNTVLSLSVANDPSLTYQWWEKNGVDSTLAANTNQLVVPTTAIGSQDYYLIVTNQSGCSSRSTDLTVSVVDAPDVSISIGGNGSLQGNTITSCTGSELTIAIPEGASIYQWYQKAGNGDTTAIQGATTRELTINDTQGAGIYYVIAAISGGCSKRSEDLIVTRVAPPSIGTFSTNIGTLNNNQITVCSESDLIISLNVNTNLLAYQWFKVEIGDDTPIQGENSAQFTVPEDGAAAQYYVIATNASGCETQSETITVNRESAPDFTPITTNPSCVGLNNGAISLSGINPSLYKFTLTLNGAPISFTDSTNMGIEYGNLGPGTYIFQADLIIEENLQCPGTPKEILLTTPDALELSLVDVINDCNNSGSGAIEVIAAGGSGSYAFTSNLGNIPQVANNTATFSNLFPNTYIITVTDTDAGAGACPTAQISQEVRFSSLAFDQTALEVSNDCEKNDVGVIKITALNGIGTYNFSLIEGTDSLEQISNQVGVASFIGLGPATYNISVEDDLECPTNYPTPITIAAPANVLSIDIVVGSVEPVSCGGLDGANGKFVIDVSDGVENYDLFLDDGLVPTYPQVGEGQYEFPFLNIGSHEVKVIDNLQCVDSVSQVITASGALIAFAREPSDVKCNGGADGQVEVQGFKEGYGGDFIFSLVSAPQGFVLLPRDSTEGTFSDLIAGDYRFSVTDNEGCINNVDVTITEPTILGGLGTNQINLNCNGDSTGQITVKGLGGTPGYTYAQGQPINFQASDLFSDLSAGNYEFWIQDANLCISPDPVLIEITQPDPLVPTSTFSSNTDFCQNEALPVPVRGVGIFANGVFSGLGISGNAGTQVFDPSQIVINDSVSETVSLIFLGNDSTTNACPFVDTFQVTVFAPPKVQITFPVDGSEFCKDNINYSLSVDSTLGSLGGMFAGNGILGDFYNPSLVQDAQGSTATLVSIAHTVQYVYTDSTTGCANVDSVQLTANPLPRVDFETDLTCVGDTITFTDLSMVGSSSEPITSRNWNFGDGDGIEVLGGITDIEHVYSSAGKFQVGLIITDNLGCLNELDSLIAVGSKPDASFTWDKARICLGDSVAFIYEENEDSEFEGRLETWLWTFGDGTDTTITAPDTGTFIHPNPLKHLYSSETKTEVSLAITTNIGCTSTQTESIFILNTETLAADDTYFDDFDGNTLINNWYPEGITSGLSWKQSTPVNKVAITSPNNVWITGDSASYLPLESSWVNSPCFDLRALERPMIRMDIFPHTDYNIDGAVLQILDLSEDTPMWKNVGDLNTGISWYNSDNINGDPGIQGVQPKGWSGQATDWCEARHLLDGLVENGVVRFRVAFGSALSNPELDGFAFDDVWIGSRPKKALLVEHFTNNSSAGSNASRTYIKGLQGDYGQDLIPIEYHTSFPSPDDVFYQASSGPVNARALYYKIPSTNHAVLDGNVFNAPTAELTQNLLNLRLLDDPNFGFELETNMTNTGNIEARIELDNIQQDTVIKCLLLSDTTIQDTTILNLQTSEIILFQAVLGRILSSGGENFEFVQMGMLPDAAGTEFIDLLDTAPNGKLVANISNSWAPADYAAFSPFVQGDSVELIFVSWLQDYETGEIYQVATTDTTVTKSSLNGRRGIIADEEFNIFPNPANTSITIHSGQIDTSNMIWRLNNIYGATVFEGAFSSTGEDVIINTSNLAEGIYLLICQDGQQIWQQKRIMVRH